MEFRQALAVGSVLAGDYRIASVLGQGGFGLTYKADDLRLGNPVAVKEYFPADLALRESGLTVVPRSAREQGVFEWGRGKFLEEARTLARFRHPNIVRVSRLFEANNTAYMVLDFEMGPNLAEWRADLGRVPTQSEIDRIAEKLLDAVDAVHSDGILHRDIKPANVIMRDGGEPVLIDFGAARQALSAQSRTVHAIVTPGYSPKEQYAVDLDRQGAWSDIYALGATLYFLVTGKPPPDALSRDLGDEMPMDDLPGGEWRPGFLAAIDQAMRVKPEQRPQSTSAWRAMLLAKAPSKPAGRIEARTRADSPRSAVASATPPLTAPPAQPRTFGSLPASPRPPTTTAPRGNALVVAAVLAGALSIGGLGVWVGVIAPARDEAAWQHAASANTAESYGQYAAEQPSGRHTLEARRRRAERTSEANRPPPPATSPAAVPDPVRSASAAPPATAPVAVNPTPPAIVQPPQTPAASEPSASNTKATKVATSKPSDAAPPSQPAQPSPSTLEPRSLPGPLSDDEIASLATAASPATWQFSSNIFAGDRIPGFTEQDVDFLAELERVSGGKLRMTPIPNVSDASRSLLLPRVSSGRDLVGWHAPLLQSGRDLEFTILAGAVPFGLEPAEHVRWLRADGARFLEQMYAAAGTPVRAIPCGIAGGVGAWFRKEVRSPTDFRGMKIRGGHLITRALRKLDAEIVTVVANSALNAAFAANRIDANFGVTPLTGVFLAQPRTASVYHFPSGHSPSYLFDLVMGGATWASMTDPQRRLIDEACRRNLDRWATVFPSTQNAVLDRIRGQRIVVRPFTGPVREAQQKALTEILAEESARNERFRNILLSYDRFRR